jgi:hypothetical protein
MIRYLQDFFLSLGEKFNSLSQLHRAMNFLSAQGLVSEIDWNQSKFEKFATPEEGVFLFILSFEFDKDSNSGSSTLFFLEEKRFFMLKASAFNTINEAEKIYEFLSWIIQRLGKCSLNGSKIYSILRFNQKETKDESSSIVDYAYSDMS